MPGSYKVGGFRSKYEIKKANGLPIAPEAQYFVLRVDTDPNARVALKAYADAVRAVNQKFAEDLDQWLVTLAKLPIPE